MTRPSLLRPSVVQIATAVALVAVTVGGVLYVQHRHAARSCTPVSGSRASRLCIPHLDRDRRPSWQHPASIATAAAGVGIAVGVIVYRRRFSS